MICHQCEAEFEPEGLERFCSIECSESDRTGLSGLSLAIYLYVEKYEGAGGAGIPEEDLYELFGPGTIEQLEGAFAAGDLRWAKAPVVTARDKKGWATAIDGGDIRTGRAWETHVVKHTYIRPESR